MVLYIRFLLYAQSNLSTQKRCKSSFLTLRGARLLADGALPLVREVDDVGVPDPGAVVLEDLLTVGSLRKSFIKEVITEVIVQ